MGIQLAVAALTELKDTMERGCFLLEKEINGENLLELIELAASLEEIIQYHDTQIALALEQKSTYESTQHSDDINEINDLLKTVVKQFEDKLTLCLDSISELALSSGLSSDADDDNDDIEVETAGILPAYSYAKKGTFAFFPVPETEAVTVVDSLQYKVNNMLGC